MPRTPPSRTPPSQRASYRTCCHHRVLQGIEATENTTELLTLRISGANAAFHFRVVTKAGEQTYEIDPIDVMTFDQDGRITSMRAFWAPTDMVQR